MSGKRFSLLPLLQVGITGLEPATSRPPDVCATNCAKSRSVLRVQRYGDYFNSPNNRPTFLFV